MSETIKTGARRFLATLGVGAAALALWLGGDSARHSEAAPNADPLVASRYIYSDLADKVLPSVVTVYVKHEVKPNPEMEKQMEKLREFFGDSPMFPNMPQPGQPREAQSSGSGVIISEDGYILTNWHVVGDDPDHSKITVVFSDDSEISEGEVKVVDSSQFSDLALLKVERKGLTPIKWGDSNNLRIGEQVAAIGSPLDLRQSITSGIVCAKSRDFDQSLGQMIQIDAVINPGSSGGPLVNLDGELVGINRMITSNNGAWQGYGFAIPASSARSFADEVMTSGKKQYGYIGISMKESEDTEEVRRALWLDPKQEGILVIDVTADQPADKAGIQRDDLITKVDGIPMRKPQDLIHYIAERPVGSKVEVTLLRGQIDKDPKEHKRDLTIGVRPPETELLAAMRGEKITPRPTPQSGEDFNKLGLRVEQVEKDSVKGLLIIDVEEGSPAAKAGLMQGDIITNLNGNDLTAVEDLKSAIEKQKGDRGHSTRFIRQGTPLRVVIPHAE